MEKQTRSNLIFGGSYYILTKVLITCNLDTMQSVINIYE